MPLPRCLVVAPWEEPAPVHATLAIAPIELGPRGHLDAHKAKSTLGVIDGDVSTFREYAKVPRDVRNRSPEMDAFCTDRLAKGQTWNLPGLLHVMSDEAAHAALSRGVGGVPVQYLVARFGDRGAAMALPSIEHDATVVHASAWFIESTELAKICVRDFSKSPRRGAALAYLNRYPEAAALAAIPLAVGKGKTRVTAREALRALARDHAMAIAEVAARHGEEARAAVDMILRTTEPLAPPKLPAFADPAALVSPATNEATQRLLGILALSTLDEPRAELDAIRAAFDERALAEFAWSLFRAWLAAGGPAKEDWAFAALGHFGDDDIARKVAPLVRGFPAEGFHARAALGLDVLAAIGTDIALMHLHAIAQRIKFKALQDKAAEKIAAVAKSRGLESEELADRLVPSVGLDARGGLDLDFGTRVFRVTFDETLAPRIRDGEALHDDLPRVRKGDDVAKAEAALETWRALKNDVKTLSAAQIGRLELAMSNARRWRVADFRGFIVEHPLLVHLARRLVWRAMRSGECFRVDEGSLFTTASDAPFTLADDDEVMLLHPVDAAPADLVAFGRMFADYRIIQPFEQLGRSVYRLTDGDLAASTLRRFEGRVCPTHALLRMDTRSWRRGADDDGITHIVKRMGDFEATLHFDPGFPPGEPLEVPEQRLVVIRVGQGETFAELAPSQRSDLLRDVERLLA